MGRIRVAFVDRDGTINVEKGYVYRAADFELIPGCIEALKLLRDHAVAVYIVTNQAGIAKGYFTESDFHALTRHMLRLFQKEGITIEDVLYCPHHPNGTVPEYTRECTCRKPGTGLIEGVMEREGLLPAACALVGDKKSDIDAGVSLGLTTYLVLTGYGRDERSFSRAAHVADDLLSAARHIVGER